MALKLTVISEQHDALGARDSIVLGVGGGSIGRAHDNDWVLPDPQRYLSAHHARVRCEDGHYYIEDTSTNGVYLNSASAALGRRGRHPLHDGDQLRLGDYRIRVQVDVEPENHAEASAIFPVTAAGAHGPGGTSSSIRSDFSVAQLFRGTDGSNTSRRGRAVDAFGLPSTTTTDTGMRAFDSGQRSMPERGVPERGAAAGGRTGAERVLIPAAARRALRAAAQEAGNLANGTGDSLFEHFCRGAGIDTARMPADVQVRALHLAGLLLREALAGLKGLALRQHEVRGHHRIGIASEDLEHSALQSLPVEDLLVRLFMAHDQHELDAVQWLRNTLGIARRHDAAAAHALPAALAEFIALLAPPQPAAGPAADERFRSITDMPDGELPHLFSEAYARAFGREFKRTAGDAAARAAVPADGATATAGAGADRHGPMGSRTG